MEIEITDTVARCFKCMDGYTAQTQRLLTKEETDAISWGVQWADTHRLPNPIAKRFYDDVKELRIAQIMTEKGSTAWKSKVDEFSAKVDETIRNTESKLKNK